MNMGTDSPYDKSYFDEMEMYASNPWRLRTYRRTIAQFTTEEHNRVLDIGCGHGYLVEHLNKLGWDAYGVDCSPIAAKRLPDHRFLLLDVSEYGLPMFEDKAFQVVISTDFLEHVRPDKLDLVVGEMARIGRHVLARVGTKPEKRSTGIDTHETVQPKSWWQERYPEVHFF